jgi:hypothetical protein
MADRPYTKSQGQRPKERDETVLHRLPSLDPYSSAERMPAVSPSSEERTHSRH